MAKMPGILGKTGNCSGCYEYYGQLLLFVCKFGAFFFGGCSLVEFQPCKNRQFDAGPVCVVNDVQEFGTSMI